MNDMNDAIILRKKGCSLPPRPEVSIAHMLWTQDEIRYRYTTLLVRDNHKKMLSNPVEGPCPVLILRIPEATGLLTSYVPVLFSLSLFSQCPQL